MTGALVEPVFGVHRSISGLRWAKRRSDHRRALALSQKLDLPEIVGEVLAARSVSIENVDQFIDPKLRDHLPDPSSLSDMDRAVNRLVKAVSKSEPIAVFGDYDVDGATSSALLRRFFGALGVEVDVYIPDRVKEGYGPTEAAFQKLLNRNSKVILTVDCGTTAYQPLKFANEAGLDVIVLDHHSCGLSTPECVALVNPNRLDDKSGQGMLAAVGVVFLFLVALNRALRLSGFFKTRREPDLLAWLDLVALGTVCDVVPLRGINRALVIQGIKVLARRTNVGLAVLGDIAGLEGFPDTYHLGFTLGPRINAGGRVGDPDLGHQLLTTDDREVASKIACRLDQLNKERRTIESLHLEEAFAQVAAQGELSKIIITHGSQWHPGVIGLIASRLTEQFRRPSLVIAFEGSEGKGSGRSIRGIDLGAMITGARQAGILKTGGGHPMAAGFTVSLDRLSDLQKFIEKRASTIVKDANALSFELDAVLDLGGVTPDLIRSFEKVGPFGSGNPRPRVAFSNLRVIRANPVGDGSHVSCIFASVGGKKISAIAFRAADRPIGQALMSAKFLHVAGSLRINTWGGKQEAQLFIEDVAYSSSA